MMALRIRGSSYRDIATEFNVSEDTVERTLSFAKKAGLIASFEDRILQELMPAAIETYKKAMENGNVAIATEVFKGTGFLLKPQEKAKTPVAEAEDSTLEIYITKLRGGLPEPEPEPMTALPPHREVEAELVSEETPT